MNARKFTAGPWRSVPTTLHGIGTLTIRRDVVSDGAPYSPAFIAGDITPSDAALFAAAPDLYAALQIITETPAAYFADASDHRRWCERTARAALDKARSA